MDKAKLIEKLKYQLERKLQYQHLDSKGDVVYITKEDAEFILTTLTAPVPDGKVSFTQAEIAEMKEERYNTGYNVGYSEGKLNGYHPF